MIPNQKPVKTLAIKRFLVARTHDDLASLYTSEMEVQVNVAQDGGDRVTEDFKGRKWQGYTDGLTTWKAFRIPWKANSEPEYKDSPLQFDLDAHAEGIGMTGWNWAKRVSKWVAFDFDAIIGHSQHHKAKLTNEQLDDVRKAAFNLPWVTIRKSTSGTGLHLYVKLDNIPTANHSEHAALARAILGKMAALTGFDFASRVDICGGNMWVWHRKMRGTEGLTLLKTGGILPEVPHNWRDHIKVIKRQRRKNLPKTITDPSSFEQLTGQRPKVKFDEEHQKLINWLEENNAFWWWDQDHHMLVTHTYPLKQAHEELGFRGFFNTASPGSNIQEQNCFAFPLRRGAWALRRYTPGVQEHSSWEQDGAGWTRCYYNREPDLGAAARAFNGIEDPSGGFEFREAECAIKAAQLLGVTINLPPTMGGRRSKLKQHRDGRLIVEIQQETHDRGDAMDGWLVKRKSWTRIFNSQITTPDEPDVANYDDLVRKLVVESDTREDAGWMIKTDAVWGSEPIGHIKIAIESLGFSVKEVKQILGSSIFRSWRIVNMAFQPEYPGDRQWNRNAAQLRFLPTQDTENLSYPTWLKILNHCGSGLNDAIQKHPWCKANGIVSGADYLKCWIASVFQFPHEPLPYLFFYGPEDSGKSSFHEAIKLLLTKGYKRADTALQNQSGFNGELEGAIICIVEETDLKGNKTANRRIKDWVTSQEWMCVHKGRTPIHIPNSMHFIQCDNDFEACPVFPGDTRITMCYVKELNPLELIPKKKLIPMLEKEAPDFLAELLNLELPESGSRLNIPIISTHEKAALQRLNQNELEIFIEDKCVTAEGHMIKLSTFYDKFIRWLDPARMENWSKIRVGKRIPPQFPKGRRRQDGQHYIGNLWWRDEPIEPKNFRYTLNGKYLESTNA